MLFWFPDELFYNVVSWIDEILEALYYKNLLFSVDLHGL